MRALGPAGALALLLAGCANDSPNDLGRTPPVVLTATERLVAVRLTPPDRLTGIEQDRLSDAIGSLGGPASGLRAQVQAASETGAAVRRGLIGLGLDPDRVTLAVTATAPADEALVSLRRTRAAVPDCGQAMASDAGADAAASLISVSRCIDARNLAAMLVDPGDLATSPHPPAGDGAAAAGSVRAWRTRQGDGLPSVTPKPPGTPSTAGGDPAQATPTTP